MKMNDAYEINHMWTADMKSNEEWPSQLWSQFLQLRKEAWKKFRTSMGLFISSYLSREQMNPKLTCSQRQWLHSSVGRASHRYREVTGLSPVEVLNFFQASLRNCKNCDHNCEDHSSFDFISAVHIWFISYASFIFISFTGTYEPKIDLLPTPVAS